MPALGHAQAIGTLGPAEVIRGRIMSDSGKPLAATVIATRGPDRLTQQTTADSNGYYRIQFEQGTGDYLVYASATGFGSARRRVQRQTNEREIVANFTLTTDLTLLAATKVAADRPIRASNPVGPTIPETGASERYADGVNGQLPPTLAGDLSSIMGMLPNVTLTPGGPSILGSGPGSTLTTLNGMATGTTSVPRAARTETRVTGATYDATRGGFSGANVDVRLASGNRGFQQRNAFLTVNPRSLQFTDPTSRALGATSGGFRASAGADGEIIRDALTYNISVDFARSISNPATLLDGGSDVFLRAGASPDSVRRLVSIANPLGLPLTTAGIPGVRQHDGFTLLSRFDDTRDTLDHKMLTAFGSYNRDGAQGVGVLSAPSTSNERRQQTLGLQYVQDNFVGPGRRVLNEVRLSTGGTSTHTSPYRQTPSASVLVRSLDAGGGTDISSILLGGGAATPSNTSNWFAEGADETTWNAGGRRHHFKTLLWGRADGVRQEFHTNELGAFSFNSIADLSAGHAASFSRTLSQPIRQGTTWNTATAFSYEYAPSNFVSTISGLRVEADGFGGAPPPNAALQQALGVRTGAAPARLHLSPRLGFSYRYNRDRDNGGGTMQNQVGRYYRTPVGTLRGGIGDFRDLLQPGSIADARASTGLPGATSYLSCVGSAVPAPNWSSFASSPSSIPSTCADGSGALGELAPPVSLISPSFDVPHSWRASLDWTSTVGRWTVQVSTLGSYDLDQPGIVDANFGGTQRFTLRDEANRPVYVQPTSIDAASGFVSPASARMSNQFGAVNERVSDLRGYGGQMTFRIAPDFRFRGGGLPLFGSLGYTLQSIRRQYRGFDGAAVGDPRTKEWAPSGNDARHVFVLAVGTSNQYLGVVTLSSRVQSGLPFTPIVQGDVNGDGRSGDRAFIPDPSAPTTDATLGAALRSLISGGSASARACVNANIGRVAGRNACRGPWTESLNMQWSPRLPQRFAQRITSTVYLQNVLGGLDEALHGSTGMHGWGSPAAPDPVLLVPRGFNPSTQSFRYDVSARFADTRPGRTLLADPFRLMVDFSFNLTVNPDLQQLRRAVEPVRGPSGYVRRGADSLTAFYLRQTSSIHKVLLAQSDSLFLTPTQTIALRRADSVYSAAVLAIYEPLAEYLAQGAGGAGKAELDSVTATQKEYWKVFWRQPEIADSIITPAQRQLMPIMLNLLSVPQQSRPFSQFRFGSPVTMPRRRPAVAPVTTTPPTGRDR